MLIQMGVGAEQKGLETGSDWRLLGSIGLGLSSFFFCFSEESLKYRWRASRVKSFFF